MSNCLLFLYSPDFGRDSRFDPLYSPTLVAHALQRQLSLRYHDHAAYVSPGEPVGFPVDGHPRWGFRLFEGAPDPETLGCLARRHPDATHVVLGTAPGRAAALLPALQGLDVRVEVWTPEPVAPSLLAEEGFPEDVPVQALKDALRLTTAHPVGVFADPRLLERAAGLPGWKGRLLRAAELVGSVVTARLYSPAEGGALEFAGPAARTPVLDPGVYDDPARGSEEALREDLFRLLDDPFAPQSWIIVSDAVWLPNLIRRARARGIRVLLWPWDEEGVPAAVRAEADGAASLKALLLPDAGERVPAAPPRGAQPVQTLACTIGVRETEALREESLPPSSVAAGARLGPWVRLIYHVECTLRQNQWSRIAFRKLAASLSQIEEFGPTPANALMWLNRAKSEGMLLVDQEVHRSDPGIRVTTCRPQPEHPVGRAALEVPDRCLRLLHQMLQKMPWVSFKLLRSVLLREQWLGGPAYQLDEASVDEWLNFLIHDGALSMTKEPNLVNPEYPVTALRINEAHPLSRAVVQDVSGATRLAAERAILAVDHFLTRNRKPWMSMSALRRALDGMGREELQEVLQGLQSLGALITESYPNPQKEHFTTGCRLKTDEQIVQEALGTRNAIIRVAQYHQRYRGWVPLCKVEEELDGHQGVVAGSQRLAWFLLLRDEGILELDHDGPLPDTAWGSVRCRLNVTDAVVQTVVAELHEGSPDARPLPPPSGPAAQPPPPA